MRNAVGLVATGNAGSPHTSEPHPAKAAVTCHPVETSEFLLQTWLLQASVWGFRSSGVRAPGRTCLLAFQEATFQLLCQEMDSNSHVSRACW